MNTKTLTKPTTFEFADWLIRGIPTGPYYAIISSATKPVSYFSGRPLMDSIELGNLHLDDTFALIGLCHCGNCYLLHLRTGSRHIFACASDYQFRVVINFFAYL